MKTVFIQEPQLQFGQGPHIDIRFGIAGYKPLDYRDPLAPKSIPLGIVGTDRSISELRAWLDTCAQGIEAKVTDQPKLFPRFPGFGADSPFDAKLVFDTRLERQISTRDLPRTVDRKGYNSFIAELVNAYIKEAQASSERGASVVVCAVPLEALHLIDPDEPDPEDTESSGTLDQDFHDLLKARAMQVQTVKPNTDCLAHDLFRERQTAPATEEDRHPKATRCGNPRLELPHRPLLQGRWDTLAFDPR